MRWTVAVAVAVVAAVVLGGCTSTEGEPTEIDLPTSTASLAPTPTQAPSTAGPLLDKRPAEPERPKDARTPESAEAYALYVLQVIHYAYGQGEDSALEALLLDGGSQCRGCAQVDKDMTVFEENQIVVVPDRPVAIRDTEVLQLDGEFPAVKLTVDQPREVAVRVKNGEAAGSWTKAESPTGTVNLAWVDGRWMLRDYVLRYS